MLTAISPSSAAVDITLSALPPVPTAHNGLGERVSPTPTPAPSARSLTKTIIADAIARSRDDGCTLDFSNRELMEVSDLAAEQLSLVRSGEDEEEESCILRIALVGNVLSTLPNTFSLLSRLRYLTLRSNLFTEFPEVLTQMPSLEILDFSRNKLRTLPSEPGFLANLRVLSVSRNRIRKLPSSLSKYRALTVLKVDHNPLEWPPASVLETRDDLEDPDAMSRWVVSMKSWLTKQASEAYSPSGSSHPDEFPSPLRELQDEEDNNASRVYAGISPHARSFSVDSQTSTYTSSSFGTPMNRDGAIVQTSPERPPPLDFTNISPTIPAVLSASPDSYLPTPDDSYTEDDIPGPLSYSSRLVQERDRQHGRNRSYAHEGQSSVREGSFISRKSLPDLRSASTFQSVRAKARADVPDIPPLNGVSRISPTAAAKSYVTPASSIDKTEPPATASSTERRDGSPTQSRPTPRPPKSVPSKSDGRAPSMDYERNSYFRRLSTLPASTIARTIPPALLTVVDRVRGILFAVSQIYQSLQHYTVYAIDERLSAVLLKVLDPASSYMLQLIMALDHFDASSRKGFPPPSICRRVIESCRDNVAVFGKAVGVLALQLKVLASHDDVRYSRQMLLVLYGAMAEIANAWQGMAPQLEAIEHLLRESSMSTVPKPLSLVSSVSTIRTTQGSSSNRIQIPPIAEQPEHTSASAPAVPAPLLPRPAGPPISRTHSAQPVGTSTPPASGGILSRPTTSDGRARMNRRHAGSFSVEDLEIGRSLPSNFDEPLPIGGVASGSATPTPRSHPPMSRPGPSHSSKHRTPTSTIPPFVLPPIHSRESSTTSAASALPIPSLAGPSRSLTSLDVPSSSTTLVDKEAIDAMAGAVRAAPAVWSLLDEISHVMPEAPLDLRDSLSKAQDVTHRLGENIKAIQEGFPSADRKALREDAHVFVKAVISLSKVIKDYGAAHKLSSELRSNIARLTNATQEFVILLHVSSYSPSSTPRPYSPMALTSNLPHPPTSSGSSAASAVDIADKSLHLANTSSGLSRSRSAQPSTSSKLVAPPMTSLPRSALPNQSFKIPAVGGGGGSVSSSSRANSRLRNDYVDTDGHG